MELWDHQKKALNKLRHGSVLVGGTGSGKSLVALSYYLEIGGLDGEPPIPLYIITTAMKRDEGDWPAEAAKLGITELVVDSWNNIKKYSEVSNGMFIFDEQRVIGSGVWVKSFIKIAKANRWVLLSATPADTWMDLIPVFIANGFYKNRTHFIRRHVNYAPFVKYPKILSYNDEYHLKRLRDRVFVLMPSKKKTTQHIHKLKVDYNEHLVKEVLKTQWDPYYDNPITSFPKEVYIVRRVINSHPSRIFRLMSIQRTVKRLIIFYNYTFELDIMRFWFEPITIVGERNSFKHNSVPEADEWVYLVQYNSGSEAWECFTTNHMGFYSTNYSYRKMKQARGRIDRGNTHFKDLYYYELESDSYIDKAVRRAHDDKKDFNLSMLDPRELHGVL
jgi:hypothetical protein